MVNFLKKLTAFFCLPLFLAWTAGVWIYIEFIHVPNWEDDPVFLGPPTELLALLWGLSVMGYAVFWVCLSIAFVAIRANDFVTRFFRDSPQ